MPSTIQARLDSESEKALQLLRDRHNLSDSELVRNALKLLASCTAKPVKQRIIGLGKIRSGVSDLGSNKRHLKGFGS